jgi:predicted aspartyl protease
VSTFVRGLRVRIGALSPGQLQPGLRAGFAVAALLACLTPPVTAGSDRPQSTAGSEETSLLALPTTHDHIGRVVVQAMVNGKGPFRFIVDTGATHSTRCRRAI